MYIYYYKEYIYIIKGANKRPEKYVSKKTIHEKTRRIIYEFSYKMGVLNEKRCKKTFGILFLFTNIIIRNIQFIVDLE